MKNARLSLSVASALLLAAPLASAEAPLVAKQLSGPPEEFAAMRSPDPADATIHSKSALLPVTFGTSKSGRSAWSGDLPVENGRLRFLVFAGGQPGWQVSMADPTGRQEKSAAQFARDVRSADFGIDQATYPAQYYALDNLTSGAWTLKIAADAGAQDGYVLVEGDASTELASYQTHKRQQVGQRIGIAAQLTATDADERVLFGADAGRIDSALMRVTSPAGKVSTYPMFDDGRHGDGAAGDGVYAGDFPAEKIGRHLAQVEVRGVDRSGQAIIRTAEHIVPIVGDELRLASTKAAASAARDGASRLTIAIPVSAQKSGRHYRAYAEVWGTGSDGAARPIAWVSGMTSPKSGTLDLGFDERWIVRAAAKGPYTLRNLRIEDADHFVTVAQAAELPLTMPTLRTKAKPSDIVVDDVMTQGPRPQIAASEKGVGSRLLLVHGYCSGGVWPAGQFTNASTFLDANQNRTHDQFARLLQSYGSTWNSFGVVAHSQGGAAALHLYTYYWSGLDNATGSRLIQSVGTPYKGTNLAGILATLGSWFGVGCGTNDNLSYSGASSWLAGIPTARRAKVNYYTTAFRTTNWYTNDYCNFATDLVLSDPEDGTTEQTNGQLSGAVNRGHTAGQCHTSGMRDPAQTQDSSRNATMNANAAR